MLPALSYIRGMENASHTLLNLRQLARRLGVPADWVRRQAIAGSIPCLKAGRRLLFNAEAVEAALAKAAAENHLAPAEQAVAQ